MATQADNGAADKSTLKKLALPGAVAAAGAAITFLAAKGPKHAGRLLGKVPGRANDLFADLKERVPSGGDDSTPQPGKPISSEQLKEFESRRRERKKRRERRQQRART
jgi:hypothetical protein